MTIETANFVNQFNISYPRDADLIKEGDDHIRMIKNVIKETFPNVNKSVSISADTLNYLNSFLILTSTTVTFPQGFTVGSGKTIDFGANRIQNLGSDSNTDLSKINNGDAVSYDMLHSIWKSMYPVNSIFCTGRINSNPSTLPFFSGTTWSSIAAGRYMVGFGTQTGAFNFGATPGYGGETSFTLNADRVIAHNHTVTLNASGSTSATTSSTGAHQHQAGGISPGAAYGGEIIKGTDNQGSSGRRLTSAGGHHNHGIDTRHTHSASSNNQGSTSAISFRPQWASMYFWVRNT